MVGTIGLEPIAGTVRKFCSTIELRASENQ